RRVDFHHREIRRRIGADDFRRERASIRQLDLDGVGAVDDMVVGQDVAVPRDDDARTEPAFETALWSLSPHWRGLLAEEAAEQLIGHLLIGRRERRALLDTNRDD